MPVSRYEGFIRVSWYSLDEIIKVKYFKENQITGVYMQYTCSSDSIYTVIVQLCQENHKKTYKLFMSDIDSAELITRELSRYSNW